MASESLTTYELFSVEPVAIAPRSPLYSLEPIGVGTSFVEGLTSYVSRLSAAHEVEPKILITTKIFPLYQKSLPREFSPNNLYSFWLKETAALNGLSSSTLVWVQALERLTLRSNLHNLTMLSLSEMLSARSLVRRTKAWCSGCYEDWKKAGMIVYDPLIWSIGVLNVCPIHGHYLSQQCPNRSCQRSLPVLEARSRPGYCPYCESWLGVPIEGGMTNWLVLDMQEHTWQEWVSNCISEMIVERPYLSDALFKENFSTVIKQCVEIYGFGSRKALSKQFNISDPTLHNYLKGTQNPQLGILLEVCYRLGLDPVSMMRDKIGELRYKPMYSLTLTLSHRNSREPRKPMMGDEVRNSLEDILKSDEDPYPSMRAVARRLGYTYYRLLKHFRDLCIAISARYQADQKEKSAQKREQICLKIRAATHTVYSQGYYPVSWRVEKLLGKEVYMRKAWAQKAWREAIAELGLS